MLCPMLYPIAPFNEPGKDNYCWYENFLSDEDINYILARPEWHKCRPGEIGSLNSQNSHMFGEVSKDTRRTDVSWMFVDENNKHIWEKIVYTIWTANKTFFRFDLTGCYEPAQLGMYVAEDQGHYDWHTDTSLNVTDSMYRKLSMSLLLSDPSEFEGGQLEIKVANDTPVSLEQKKGRAWFFPSWTLHRVTPVTKGIRRSLVLWVGGPGFK